MSDRFTVEIAQNGYVVNVGIRNFVADSRNKLFEVITRILDTHESKPTTMDDFVQRTKTTELYRD